MQLKKKKKKTTPNTPAATLTRSDDCATLLRKKRNRVFYHSGQVNVVAIERKRSHDILLFGLYDTLNSVLNQNADFTFVLFTIFVNT